MLVTCRELRPVSKLWLRCLKSSNYSRLQHLASQFQLGVEVTSAKALKMFCNSYVCDHQKYCESSLEKLVREIRCQALKRDKGWMSSKITQMFFSFAGFLYSFILTTETRGFSDWVTAFLFRQFSNFSEAMLNLHLWRMWSEGFLCAPKLGYFKGRNGHSEV